MNAAAFRMLHFLHFSYKIKRKLKLVHWCIDDIDDFPIMQRIGAIVQLGQNASRASRALQRDEDMKTISA